MRGVRRQLPNLWWMSALAALAIVIGAYIMGHQRLRPPGWVPVIGQHRFVLHARLANAAGVMPGQGQAVTISGVPVGEVAGVTLKDGAALLTLDIKPRFAHVHPDATILMRPKTGLKDMVAELDPGTHGPELKSGATLGTESTNPDINLDEILASLDADTRDSLVLLAAGGGQALGGRGGHDLANTLRRFAPLSRDTATATRLVAARRQKLGRLMHNLSLLAQELGQRDDDLRTFVSASNDVFARFSAQNEHLAQTLRLLPGTLKTSDTALRKLDTLGSTLRTGLTALAPTAKALGPTLRDTQPFLKTTTPVIRDQLRPFAREAQPTAAKLVPSARNLAQATPHLKSLTDVLNAIVDELAYKPKDGQSYLFYVPWANHDTNSVLSGQDGIGPLRRGLVLLNCGAMQFLDGLESPTSKTKNPTLRTLTKLLHAPDYQGLVGQGRCPKAAVPRLTPEPQR